MTSAFLKILNMSITASFVVLAVLILRLLLKKAPKWINVILWAIVAVRLVCPAFIESEFSLIPHMETIKPSDDEKKDLLNQTNSNDTSISDSTISDATLNNAISDANEKDCSIFDTSINNSLEFSIPENIEVSNTINDTETYAPDISSIVTEENSFFEETKNNTVIDSKNNVFIKKILPIISKVWVSGIVAMILYFVISYVILYKKVQTAVLLKDNIYKSENVGSPFVFGIIFPKIYIPFNMDEKEAFYVISHEKTHLSRWDNLWKPLGFLLLTVYWFNPFIWLAYVLFCKDIEYACDEKVIKGLPPSQKVDYAQTLLSLSVGKKSVSACPVAFGEIDVKRRIGLVLNYKKPAFWVIIISLVLCVALIVFFLTDPTSDKYKSDETSLIEQSTNESNDFSEQSTDDFESQEESSTEDVVDIEFKIECKDFDESNLDFCDNKNVLPYQISVNKTIKNFKFIKVFYDEHGKPYESGILYGTEFLTPNDNFHVRTYIRNRFSNRGISYTNEKGECCFGLISYDEKGRISIKPFESIEKKETEISFPLLYGNGYKNEIIRFDGTVSGLIYSISNIGIFNDSITSNFFYIENGVAHIDFNNEYHSFLSNVNNTMGIGVVVNSLLAYYGDKGVQRVLITVNDEKEIRYEEKLFLSEIGNNNFDDGKHYALITMLDINSLEEYYQHINFDGTIEGLISEFAKKGNWGEGIIVNSFELKDGNAHIDFNKAFSDGIGLMNESRVDHVCAAIKSYYNVKNVKLTIEGKPFQSVYDSPPQIVGNIATELSFSKEEFFKWLNGTSDTYINDGTEKIINIHNCGQAEHARSLINRKKLFWLTLNEVIFEPSDTINVAFHDEKSVRVFFYKPISFVFFFYDQSYDEALNNGITALIEQLNKEIPDSWNMEKYELIQYSLYDHEKNEYIPTNIYYSQNNNRIYFVFNGCMISIYDRDGLYTKDDFSKLGFVSAT